MSHCRINERWDHKFVPVAFPGATLNWETSFFASLVPVAGKLFPPEIQIGSEFAIKFTAVTGGSSFSANFLIGDLNQFFVLSSAPIDELTIDRLLREEPFPAFNSIFLIFIFNFFSGLTKANYWASFWISNSIYRCFWSSADFSSNAITPSWACFSYKTASSSSLHLVDMDEVLDADMFDFIFGSIDMSSGSSVIFRGDAHLNRRVDEFCDVPPTSVVKWITGVCDFSLASALPKGQADSLPAFIPVVSKTKLLRLASKSVNLSMFSPPKCTEMLFDAFYLPLTPAK